MISRLNSWGLCLGVALATIPMVVPQALAEEPARPLLLLTSTNDAHGNDLAVFELSLSFKPTLKFVQLLPTGGTGGASGNGGIVQFDEGAGAVANFGSDTVTRLTRRYDTIDTDGAIQLAKGCQQPDSVALRHGHLYVVGVNCAESHRWPEGYPDGVVKLQDASAGQIAAGDTWAGVTLKSGSVLQLPLARSGALNGQSMGITLPSNANNTPLGAAFWGDLLGFNPAHSVDSFALVSPDRTVYPVAGPTPSFPSNAPCWLAKGRGNVWYAGNSPGEAISIFFSDGKGGAFYKSVPVPGVVTDLHVSHDGKWLAAIYTSGGSGFVTVFSIDDYGDLSLVATSNEIGVASFNGLAISQ